MDPFFGRLVVLGALLVFAVFGLLSLVVNDLAHQVCGAAQLLGCVVAMILLARGALREARGPEDEPREAEDQTERQE